MASSTRRLELRPRSLLLVVANPRAFCLYFVLFLVFVLCCSAVVHMHMLLCGWLGYVVSCLSTTRTDCVAWFGSVPNKMIPATRLLSDDAANHGYVATATCPALFCSLGHPTGLVLVPCHTPQWTRLRVPSWCHPERAEACCAHPVIGLHCLPPQQTRRCGVSQQGVSCCSLVFVFSTLDPVAFASVRTPLPPWCLTGLFACFPVRSAHPSRRTPIPPHIRSPTAA